jgi:UDP-3-O-[3-hydroxymyristoyl] N-acetylglucosamine deacetylase
MIEQKTLRKALQFEGEGLHTGARAVVEVQPAAADTGLAFALTPPGGGDPVVVQAVAENVVDTSRATIVGRAGVTVSTTEHLLSALFAVGITNARIVVEGPEIPIGDGSARGFVDAIERAGIESQDRPQALLTVREPYAVVDGDRMVAILPSSAFRVRFVADFPEPIGTEYFYGEIDAASYRKEIAAARTFGYLHEVEDLRARGLALGGSLENAIVFAPTGPMQPLRWSNEVVRHKVLDLIGDFALLGAWPQCEILGIKSGHELHALVTRELRRRMFAAPAA